MEERSNRNCIFSVRATKNKKHFPHLPQTSLTPLSSTLKQVKGIDHFLVGDRNILLFIYSVSDLA